MNKMTLKSIILFIYCFSVLFTGLVNAGVKNNAQPMKGQWQFKLEKVFEIDGAGEEPFASPQGIEVDDDGKIFYFDWKYNKFFVFDGTGKFLYSFGKKGEGPGEYKAVNLFTFKGKYLMTLDFGAIHYFLKDGSYVKTAKLMGNLDVKTIVDENHIILLKSSTKGKSKTESLELLDLRDNKRITIAETTAEKPLTATMSGMTLNLSDATNSPSLVITTDGKSLFFAQNSRYLIRKTDLQGEAILSFSVEGKKRKPISEEVKRNRFTNIILNGEKMPKAMVNQLVKDMPDYCTYFYNLKIDDSGMIYAYVSDLSNKRGEELDIFSAEGKYLYRALLTLPEGLERKSTFTIKGNFLYVFAENEDGDGKIIKFKISKPTS